MRIVRDFWDWIVAVGKAYHGWMGGSALAGFVGLGQGLGWWQPTRKTYLVLIGIGLLASVFAAWRREHKFASATEPNFRVEITQAVSHYEKEHTVVFLGMRIINAGADSAVLAYKVHYHSEFLDVPEAQLLALGNDVRLKVANGFFGMRAKDAINVRTSIPIPRGGFVAGRLPFRVIGNRCNEVADGQAQITVAVKDYMGTEYSGTFCGTGAKDAAMYLSGEPLDIDLIKPEQQQQDQGKASNKKQDRRHRR